MRVPLILLLTGAASASAAVIAEPSAAQAAWFQQHIAPIFSDACYKCHSNAEAKSKGGLILDTRDGILKGGDDGKIFIAGDPTKSMLIQRVTSKDKDEVMPPKEAPLTAAQVADLANWIKAGAFVPATVTPPAPSITSADPAKATGAIAVRQNPDARKHWAWQPIRFPNVPAVRNPAAVITPVDNFIQAKLEQAGIIPDGPADRSTLIRRAYFDLIGLPPLPWEVQAFIDDKSPKAWENVIDRLLASPRYGERWGRFWLDVARYSDTKGENKKADSPLYVDAWGYRDYVIDAFNTDKPYDRFVLEQIAADKVALGQDKRPLAALGFLTLGDRFGGMKNDIINDRIDVITKGFLGLTVSCARCHDHMFDPITQKDYYSLHGILSSTVEPKDNPIIAAQGTAAQYQDYLKVRAEAAEEAKKAVYQEVDRTRAVFRTHAGDLLMASMAKGEDRTKYIKETGLTAKEVQEMSQFIKRNADNFRQHPIFGPFAVFASLPEKNFSAEAGQLADAFSGSHAEHSAAPAAPKGKGKGKGGGRPGMANRTNFPVNPQIAALFRNKHPQSLEEVAGYYTEFFRTVADLGEPKKTSPSGFPMSPSAAGPSPAQNHLAELKAAPFPVGFPADADEDELQKVLPQKAAQRFQAALVAVRKVELSHPGAPKRAMAVEDAPKPVDSPVFIRGEANNKGEVVPHRFLEILAGPNRPVFKNGSGRLELAQSIASRTNPLTPRVMVNRIWQHHFGDGIVMSPDDFGTMSEPPSHQELLDYLSVVFMQKGWSVKTIHKLIMMSAVYQRKSETNDAFAKIDPGNRLLWRFNMHRLDFEALRDSLLYMAKELDTTQGGQPVNILSEPYSKRRSVYGFIDRRNLPEMMNHFDFANPAMPAGKRHETTVPQQALFMMNSPLMIDVARKLLARDEMAQAHTDEQRIHALYWMIFQRPAKEEEKALGLKFLVAADEPNPNDPAEPSKTESTDPRQSRQAMMAQRKAQAGANKGKRGLFVPQNQGDMVERKALTAWEKYTHALLMANETIYYN